MKILIIITIINNNNNNNNNEIIEEKIKNDITKIKLPDVFSILTEKILLESSYNEPIFVSELSEMSNFSVQEKVKYYDRFCVLTKLAFLIYHSKENYITLKKPLAEIPMRYIKNIVLFKINKRMIGYDHFYIGIDKNLNSYEIYDKLDLFYFNEKKEDKIDNDEIMLMFKSMDKALIKKWFVLLNYIRNLNIQLDEQEEHENEINQIEEQNINQIGEKDINQIEEQDINQIEVKDNNQIEEQDNNISD